MIKTNYTQQGRFNLMRTLIVIAFAIAPLQFMGIKVGGSIFDIALIPFFFFALLNFYTHTRIAKVLLFVILGYSVVFLIMSYSSNTPPHRIISAASFYILYGYVLTSIRINISISLLRTLSKTLFLTCTSLAIIILCQYFLLGQSRPHGPFSEPSGAGLYLASLLFSFGLVTIFFPHSIKRVLRLTLINTLSLFLAVVLLLGAVLITRSVSFGALLVTLLFFQVFLGVGKRTLTHTFVLLLLIVLIFSTTPIIVVHYSERLNFSQDLNLSQLAWLQGLSQAIYALETSPIWGLGPGSTGYLGVENQYTYMLDEKGFAGLNFNDAYSGAYRLIIELGIVSILLLGFLLKNSLNQLRGVTRGCYNEKDIHILFLFMFGLGLMIGILLKEPVWSRSFVAVSTLSIGIAVCYLRQRFNGGEVKPRGGYKCYWKDRDATKDHATR